MVHGQAGPLAGSWLGINRLAAPHLLGENESPDTVNTAPKNGRVGLLGPRAGRRKLSLTAFANRVVGILPYSPPGVGVGGGTGGGTSGDGGGEILVAQDDNSSVIVVSEAAPWQGAGGGAWPGPTSPLPRRYSLSWTFDIAASGWTSGSFVDEASIGPITYTTGAKIGIGCNGGFNLYTETANPWANATSYVEVHVVETGGHWVRLFQDQHYADPGEANYMSAPQFLLVAPTTYGAPSSGTIDKIRATVEVVPLGFYSGRFRSPGPIKLTVIPVLAEV